MAIKINILVSGIKFLKSNLYSDCLRKQIFAVVILSCVFIDTTYAQPKSEENTVEKSTSTSSTEDKSDPVNETSNQEMTAEKKEVVSEPADESESASGNEKVIVSEPRDSDAIIETTDVVSTRLKKMDLAGPSPEIRISVEDILKSGQTSIADFLRDNPVTSLGSRRERSGLAATAGAATLDLRGMGDTNTLVLLNGVRFPPMSGSDAVDINRIPLAVVKEIKIIKDDLSSIYGSDAMGGVVNIITHKDFDGFQANVGRSFTTLGGGEKLDVNLLAGSSSAKSNVTFALGYSKKDRIYSRDRDWSKSAVSAIGSPGSYRDVGASTWSVDPSCDPNDIMDAGSQGQFCGYNYAKHTTSLPQVDQLTIFTHLNHKFSEFTEFYSEFYYNRTQTNYIYAPSPGFFNVPSAVADTYGLPNHTNGNDMEVRYRVLELGNRDTYQENNFFGVTSGLKHEFFDTWSVNLAGSYGRDRNDELGYGNALTKDLVSLVESGQFKPFDPPGTRGDLSSAAYQTSSLQQANFYTADLKFSGELGELFGSPYILDIGTTYISRDYSERVDSEQEKGNTFTGAGSSGGAKRNVHSLYAQLNGRLSQSTDIFLAARYDKYNDFGDTFNPKFGIKFKPTSKLLFRSTIGTGFKAPLMSLLYGKRSESYETFLDYKACEQEGPGSPSCSPQQYRVISGGNRNLNEITSVSYSAGFMYEPSNLMDLSVDFWAVNQKGTIVGGSAGTLEYATRAEVKGIDPSAHGFHMNRDVNGFLDPSNPIVAPLVNLLDTQNAGLDFGFNYKQGLPIGQLVFSENLSTQLWRKSEPFPGLGNQDSVTKHLIPRWRNQFSLSYLLLKNTFRLGVTSTDKYMNAAQSGFVDSYHRLDFSYTYQGFEDTSLTLGMLNVLGTTPPLDITNPTRQLDEEFYSERGPEVYFRLTKNF